jgi:hypothetical protein
LEKVKFFDFVLHRGGLPSREPGQNLVQFPTVAARQTPYFRSSICVDQHLARPPFA